MQFGGFDRVSRLGCVVLFMMLGTVVSPAQFSQSQFGQALGNTSGQQSSCDPSDPSCQTSQPYNDMTRGRTPTQTQVPQGAVLPNEQDDQTSGENNLNNGQSANRTIYQRPKLPLDPPTEFQQMVANSLGKNLPIYGANLFRNPPTTFAPVNLIPVTPDYVIGPGDELKVQVWGQVTLNSRYIVDRSGNIYIPQIGPIHVAGQTFAQLRPYIKTQMGRVFRNFDIDVSMGQLRSIQVFVVGQARRPGSYTISSLSTLVNAIFATGGPTPQGSLRHIQLKRNGEIVVDFDLYALLLHGDKSNDVQLLPGDVIYIPPAGPQVAIAGNVKVPAIYELKSPDNSTLGEMLEMAAGLTNVASQKIRLERVDEQRMRNTVEISLTGQAGETLLRDGDLIEVGAVVSQYKGAITLRGNVANPGRYMWKPGMRILDLIPDKDALITRDYWLKRSQLGQPMLTYVPTCLPRTPYGIPSLRYGIPIGEDGGNPYWRYSSTRSQSLFGLVFGSQDDGNLRNDDSSDVENLLPGEEGSLNRPTDGGLDCGDVPESELALYGANSRYGGQAGSPLQTGNTPNALNPSPAPGQENSFTAPNNRSSSASVGAAIANSTGGQFKPRNDVKLSEPDIDWSYAVIERQSKENLTTSLLPFNLGKVILEGDASQNLELMPGDVVTIFSKADFRVPQSEQTRFVRLEGEFKSSGVYSVRPGETLKELVARAGGLSSDAYLYGSQFTRESTRRVQQQRLNEYIDQIQLQVSTNAINNAGGAISAQDSAAAAAAAAQNQTIINSLRQARASGRIVLNLSPDAHGVAQLPEMPLEDGDRFIVPRVPSTVSVDGAVYNQNAFVFDPHHRVGDYIRLAGGANRDADKKRAYVIRAGGSVLSKQYSSSLRGNGFDSLHVYPGDTIVVPLNLSKGKTLRLIVDMAQIVGQFGIAIAAANTIF